MKTVLEIGEAAKKAKRVLSVVDSETKNRALLAISCQLKNDSDIILKANAIDILNGQNSGLTQAMLDRLALDDARISAICKSIEELILGADPIGKIISKSTRPNGLELFKVTVPIGVIGVIFEARPNVSADSAVLCLKSGNAVVLRGGKEAINSNIAICKSMRNAILSAGLPEDCIQLVEDTSRESATEMMRLNGYIDLLIPRGGSGLIKSVVKNATVPVIETGAGTCHVYVDKEADLSMAANIIDNAKTTRPSVCNSCECILVHKSVAQNFLPILSKLLQVHKVEVRGDKQTCEILKDAVRATEQDWGTEYNDYILACKIVEDIEQAIEHIYSYGTGHSEAIVTNNKSTAENFLNSVDAAVVYHNASTRFTDGAEFGLGAEIGISTQKLHARGPLGLEELTSYKYKILGNGQIR